MVRKFQNIHFREFLIWSALYTLISISYRHLARSHPDSELKTSFDQFCLQVNRFTGKESPNVFFPFYRNFSKTGSGLLLYKTNSHLEQKETGNTI